METKETKDKNKIPEVPFMNPQSSIHPILNYIPRQSLIHERIIYDTNNFTEEFKNQNVCQKLNYYKKNKTLITFRLRHKPEYFFKGYVVNIEYNDDLEFIRCIDYIIIELENKEKAIFSLYDISPTSIHPSSINPIQYFERKTIPEWKRNIIFERSKRQCELQLEGCTNTATEIDHQIPISKGGSDDLSNLKASCSNCNKKKSNKVI